MFRKVFLLHTFFIVFFVLSCGLEAKKRPFVQKEIDFFLKRYVKKYQTPGVALAFIDQGNEYIITLGYSSKEDKLLVDNHTLFEIGGITNVLTCLTLAEKIRNKTVGLFDSIEKDFSESVFPTIEKKSISFWHLATHTSGFQRLPSNLNPKDLSNPYKDYTSEDLQSFLKTYRAENLDSPRFEYSNFGVGLLGYILSLQENTDYENLVKKYVLNPLNMKNTVIDIPESMEEYFANGYCRGKKVSHWDMPVLAGAGAFRSNISDMLKFLKVSLSPLNHSLKESLSLCSKKHYKIQENLFVGLGWIISDLGTSKIIWHNGGTGGFSSFIGFNPKTQRGLVILANSSENWLDEFGLELLNPDSKLLKEN